MSDYFTPRRISDRAAATIDHWTDQLLLGQLSLSALPLPLFSLYQAGVRDGRAQRDDEVRALRLEADRRWLQAFAPKDRRAFLLSRLDRAAELADRPDVDNVLDETWRIYCASLTDVRNEVTA